MVKKLARENIFYYECPMCHETIGKPAKESEADGKEETEQPDSTEV